MAASDIYSLLCILNFHRLEVNGIMRTHTHTYTHTHTHIQAVQG
jgi:hypothetical protein